MTPTLVYYITGHGYGHARRAAEVIRALIDRDPNLTIHIRTSAAKWLFDFLLIRGVHYHNVAIDSGAIEQDPLRIDGAASLREAAKILARRDEIVASETAFLRSVNASLVVADAPYLAGDIAHAAGVRCIGIANFTWDWIYEAWAAGQAQFTPLLQSIRQSYRRMSFMLRLPFSHEMTTRFDRAIDVPLITRPSRSDKQAIAAEIGIAPTDRRKRLLFGMRGGLSETLLNAAANCGDQYLFIYPEPTRQAVHENVKIVELTNHLTFADILSVCDVSLSKHGYGIVADCVTHHVALLWPPRQGFREDGIFKEQAPLYIRSSQIPVDDFEAGRWREPLQQLAQQPPPPQQLSTNGAEVCADHLLSMLNG